jgi:hypothetical protein
MHIYIEITVLCTEQRVASYFLRTQTFTTTDIKNDKEIPSCREILGKSPSPKPRKICSKKIEVNTELFTDKQISLVLKVSSHTFGGKSNTSHTIFTSFPID